MPKDEPKRIKERFNVTMERTLAEDLQRAAMSRGLSRSALVRDISLAYLREDPPPPKMPPTERDAKVRQYRRASRKKS